MVKLKKTEDGLNIHTLGEFNYNWDQIEKLLNTLGTTIEKVVAEGQLSPHEIAQLFSIVNGNIKRGDVSVHDIDINKGKLSPRHMSEEILRMMTGDAPVNAVPADGGVTSEKIARSAVGRSKLSKDVELDINKVNRIIESGKNIFDETYIENAYLTGTADELYFRSGPGGVVGIVEVEPNRTITVSKSQDTNIFTLGFSDVYPEFGDRLLRRYRTDPNASSLTTTTEFNERYMLMYVSNREESKIPEWLQVEEGEVATPHEPYEEKIKIKTEMLDKELIETVDTMDNVTTHGKNLFDGEYYTNARLTGDSDTIHLNPTGGITAVLKVKPNKTLTVSKSQDTNRLVLAFNDTKPSGEAEEYLSRRVYHGENPESITVTTQSDEHYMLIWVSTSTESKIPEWLQVEEGEVATPHEPYERIINPEKIANFIPVNSSDKNESPFIYNTISEDFVYDGAHFIDYDYDYESLYAIFDDLVDRHPEYVTRTSMIYEETGKPIYQYDFKMPEVSGFKQHKFVYTSALHGHEIASAFGGAAFFKMLCDNWNEYSLLKFLRWNMHIIVTPVLNPWGFNRSERKNSEGVDLNSNFPDHWVLTDPESTTYSGEEPLSAKAAQAMEQLMQENTDALFSIDHHNHLINSEDLDNIFWVGSTNNKVRRALHHWTLHMRGRLSTYNLDAYENLTYSTSGRIKAGGLRTRWDGLGVPSAILENAFRLEGSKEEGQRFIVECIGNLINVMLQYQTKY